VKMTRLNGWTLSRIEGVDIYWSLSFGNGAGKNRGAVRVRLPGFVYSLRLVGIWNTCNGAKRKAAYG